VILCAAVCAYGRLQCVITEAQGRISEDLRFRAKSCAGNGLLPRCSRTVAGIVLGAGAWGGRGAWVKGSARRGVPSLTDPAATTSVSLVLLLAIECLCDDPQHHFSVWGSLWPVAGYLVFAFGVAVLAIARACWVRRDRLASREPLGPHPRGRALCPFCRQGFEALGVEAAIRCPACEVRHHSECWGEHGGCSILGCRREARARRGLGRLPQRVGTSDLPPKEP
jgi:hypothetical protein